MSYYITIPKYYVSYRLSSVEKIYNLNFLLSHIEKKWQETRGKGVKIGILDSGLPIHKDIYNIEKYKNFTSSDTHLDIIGHATGVCGIVGANTRDTYGAVGIAPESTVVVGKVLDDDGNGRDEWLSDGILWCLDEGCQLINISCGAPGVFDKIFKKTKKAVEKAFSNNVFMFAAAGNDNNGVNIPAKWDEVFCIVAIDKEKRKAVFSNSGPEVDFCAIGVDIMTTFLNNTYAVLSGTSFASPAACAIGALIISEFPKMTWLEFRKKLISLATIIGTPPWNPTYGFGNISFDAPDNPLVNLHTLETYGLVNALEHNKRPSLWTSLWMFLRKKFR